MVQQTVYVVDDDVAIRRSLEWMIGNAGLQVRPYLSAEHFLASYDPAEPGCVLLDIRMAGMNGLDVQQFRFERSWPIPGIIITGHADVPAAVRTMKFDAVEFLEKPFYRQVLLEHLHDAMKLDKRVRTDRRQQGQVNGLVDRLPPRDRQILQRVADG